MLAYDADIGLLKFALDACSSIYEREEITESRKSIVSAIKNLNAYGILESYFLKSLANALYKLTNQWQACGNKAP